MIRLPSCLCGECSKCRSRITTRNWRERDRERSRQVNRDYYQRNKASWSRGAAHKVKAQKLVYTEIRAGRMTKGQCETGGDCCGPIHAHHDDYTKPLDVRWLCARHHALEHAVAA